MRDAETGRRKTGVQGAGEMVNCESLSGWEGRLTPANMQQIQPGV